MTALLSCDGCGQIVSERPEDADPTGAWWVLSQGPSIGGTSIFPDITLNLGEELEEDEAEQILFEPPRHFCSESCIAAWLERRA